jgi:putative transposase
LVVELKKKNIGPIPSYSTVRRYLQSIGKFKAKRSRNQNKPGYKKALFRKENFEIRSYENEYVCGMWHLDFHHSSRPVITSQGEIVYPICLAVIDDHSRLLCHIQWYLSETTEDLVHGFCQALQKRGIPRSLMTDNGSAMKSDEFTEGLKRLGILHETTLPYSPYQNGKQEVLWGQLEGRLMAMLGNQSVVTLKQLNDLTTAWAEMEYNKSTHSEINSTPLNRFLNHSDVSRNCPDSDYLKKAFRKEEDRTLRRSDGTISIDGKRFEISFQYKHLRQIRIQYARWDLSFVHMVNADGKCISKILPVDKTKNAEGKRRKTEIPETEKQESSEDGPLPPLLEYIYEQYQALGLPPAYIPKDQ